MKLGFDQCGASKSKPGISQGTALGSEVPSPLVRRVHTLFLQLDPPCKGNGGGDSLQLGDSILTGSFSLELTISSTLAPISWFHPGEPLLACLTVS